MTLPRTAVVAKAIAKWMDNGAKKPRRDYRRKPALKSMRHTERTNEVKVTSDTDRVRAGVGEGE